MFVSDHRGAGEGDAERSEAAGPGHGSGGLPDPQAQRPRRQVSEAAAHTISQLGGKHSVQHDV